MKRTKLRKLISYRNKESANYSVSLLLNRFNTTKSIRIKKRVARILRTAARRLLRALKKWEMNSNMIQRVREIREIYQIAYEKTASVLENRTDDMKMILKENEL